MQETQFQSTLNLQCFAKKDLELGSHFYFAPKIDAKFALFSAIMHRQALSKSLTTLVDARTPPSPPYQFGLQMAMHEVNNNHLYPTLQCSPTLHFPF
jgi:hypothetical protein